MAPALLKRLRIQKRVIDTPPPPTASAALEAPEHSIQETSLPPLAAPADCGPPPRSYAQLTDTAHELVAASWNPTLSVQQWLDAVAHLQHEARDSLARNDPETAFIRAETILKLLQDVLPRHHPHWRASSQEQHAIAQRYLSELAPLHASLRSFLIDRTARYYAHTAPAHSVTAAVASGSSPALMLRNTISAAAGVYTDSTAPSRNTLAPRARPSPTPSGPPRINRLRHAYAQASSGAVPASSGGETTPRLPEPGRDDGEDYFGQAVQLVTGEAAGPSAPDPLAPRREGRRIPRLAETVAHLAPSTHAPTVRGQYRHPPAGAGPSGPLPMPGESDSDGEGQGRTAWTAAGAAHLAPMSSASSPSWTGPPSITSAHTPYMLPPPPIPPTPPAFLLAASQNNPLQFPPMPTPPIPPNIHSVQLSPSAHPGQGTPTGDEPAPFAAHAAATPLAIPSRLPPALQSNSQYPSDPDEQPGNFAPATDAQSPPAEETAPPATISRVHPRAEGPLRKVILPASLIRHFVVRLDQLVISHLLVPKQSGTSETCSMHSEEEVAAYQQKEDLLTLGWIHTHPTQSIFLSSLDLHTHASYQRLLPESIAVVCAPHEGTDAYGVFRMTDPPGLEAVLNCHDEGAFHPHPPLPLYTDVDQEGGHCLVRDEPFVCVDLRS
ncbi:hypothetical protein JCM10908_006147 [Rhodotorula pacifica]|uniref:uncharacterized protein n=1 Tax=Rhodotorula pacifica TaxID=1495444 RepID=UPI0031741725